MSVLGTDEERQNTQDALRSAAKFIRFHLKPRLRMRQIPELEFRDDRSMEYAQQISERMEEIRRIDADIAKATSSPIEPQGEKE